MVTIFTIVKNLERHMRSDLVDMVTNWLNSDDEVQIIICCDGRGAEALFSGINVELIDDFQYSSSGDLLFAPLFREVADRAQSDTICYLEPCFRLPGGAFSHLEIIKRKKYLAVACCGGEENGWASRIDLVIMKSMLQDLFEIPGFCFMGQWWKGWLVSTAKRKKIAVIDMSSLFGKCKYCIREEGVKGEDLSLQPGDVRNCLLAALEHNGYCYSFSRHNASYMLWKNMIFPALTPPYISQRFLALKVRSKILSPILEFGGSVTRDIAVWCRIISKMIPFSKY